MATIGCCSPALACSPACCHFVALPPPPFLRVPFVYQLNGLLFPCGPARTAPPCPGRPDPEWRPPHSTAVCSSTLLLSVLTLQSTLDAFLLWGPTLGPPVTCPPLVPRYHSRPSPPGVEEAAGLGSCTRGIRASGDPASGDRAMCQCARAREGERRRPIFFTHCPAGETSRQLITCPAHHLRGQSLPLSIQPPQQPLADPA